jgi:hypothetical protein
VSLHLRRPLLGSLWREVGGKRRPSLVFHVRLHVMRMRLLWRVGIWCTGLGHAVGHMLLVLRVVHTRLWHIGIAVDLRRLMRRRRTVRLSHV